VDEEGIAALRYGRALSATEGTPEDTPVALASAGGDQQAIGERTGDVLQPRKVFVIQG
jgi:hypothetical protein